MIKSIQYISCGVAVLLSLCICQQAMASASDDGSIGLSDSVVRHMTTQLETLGYEEFYSTYTATKVSDLQDFIFPEGMERLAVKQFLSIYRPLIFKENIDMFVRGWSSVFKGWTDYFKVRASDDIAEKRLPAERERLHLRCMFGTLMKQFRDAKLAVASGDVSDFSSFVDDQRDSILDYLLVSPVHKEFIKQQDPGLYDAFVDSGDIVEEKASCPSCSGEQVKPKPSVGTDGDS